VLYQNSNHELKYDILLKFLFLKGLLGNSSSKIWYLTNVKKKKTGNPNFFRKNIKCFKNLTQTQDYFHAKDMEVVTVYKSAR